MPGESKHSERRLKAREKQRQALELRKGGATYRAIADALGYRGPQGAQAAVESALKLTLQEPADRVRQLELERLDTMVLALWSGVRGGDLGTIDRMLKLMKRRAELLGLDMPVKLEHTGPDGGPIKTHSEVIVTGADLIAGFAVLVDVGAAGTGEATKP